MPTKRNPDGSISFLNAQQQEVGRYAGVKHTPYELLTEIVKWWPEDQWQTALAICLAESAGYDKAEGDFLLVHPIMGTSIGIFQIRSVKIGPFVTDQITRHRETLFDWKINIETAYRLWLKEGWKPWGAYRNKSYLKTIKQANPALIQYIDTQIVAVQEKTRQQIVELEQKKKQYV